MSLLKLAHLHNTKSIFPDDDDPFFPEDDDEEKIGSNRSRVARVQGKITPMPVVPDDGANPVPSSDFSLHPSAFSPPPPFIVHNSSFSISPPPLPKAQGSQSLRPSPAPPPSSPPCYYCYYC